MSNGLYRIYIYIYRERERERVDLPKCIYIYIYNIWTLTKSGTLGPLATGHTIISNFKVSLFYFVPLNAHANYQLTLSLWVCVCIYIYIYIYIGFSLIKSSVCNSCRTILMRILQRCVCIFVCVCVCVYIYIYIEWERETSIKMICNKYMVEILVVSWMIDM